MLLLQPKLKRRDARVVEEARLESLYTPKAYRGFESPSLRKQGCKSVNYAIYTLFCTQKLASNKNSLQCLSLNLLRNSYHR